jgi:hypothetical protein
MEKTLIARLFETIMVSAACRCPKFIISKNIYFLKIEFIIIKTYIFLNITSSMGYLLIECQLNPKLEYYFWTFFVHN